MTEILAVLLLVAACLTGLVLVPLGLPGLWVMAGGVLIYGWMTGFASVGVATIAMVLALALLGEVIEAWLGFRYARKYGASSRASWGALAGGIAGAIIGVPIPVVGSVIGAFVGSFAGAALLEYTTSRRTDVAIGAGWGAVLGRAFAAASKIALGLIIAVIGAVAVVRG